MLYEREGAILMPHKDDQHYDADVNSNANNVYDHRPIVSFRQN